MTNIEQTIIDRTNIYITQFEELTVKQIDELEIPTGIMTLQSWNNARKLKLNEEKNQEKINKLKELLPSISTEDIEKINIKDEDNNGGLIITGLEEK